MRKYFKKYQANIINYRSYKNVSNEKYSWTLMNVSKENVISNGDGFQRFSHISHLNINKHALNKHAPCKKKHARGNQMPFFNKELWKAIWYGLNYETFSYEIEMRKINKEIFASLF